MTERNRWDYFKLQYDPEPSGRFRDIQQGYWACSAVDGNYDGDGLTPLDAMGACMVMMAKALIEYQKREREGQDPVKTA